jgi:hypothetical protein
MTPTPAAAERLNCRVIKYGGLMQLGRLSEAVVVLVEIQRMTAALATPTAPPAEQPSDLPLHVREERCHVCGMQAIGKFERPVPPIHGMRRHPETYYLCYEHWPSLVWQPIVQVQQDAAAETRRKLAEIAEWAELSESDRQWWDDKPHQFLRDLRKSRDALAAAKPTPAEQPAEATKGVELPDSPGEWKRHGLTALVFYCMSNNGNVLRCMPLTDAGVGTEERGVDYLPQGHWFKATPSDELAKAREECERLREDAEADAALRRDMLAASKRLQIKWGDGDAQFLNALVLEVERLRVRLLSAAGDDLCRLTPEEIKAYTSGAVKIPPREEFIPSCERFHAQIAGEAGVLENCLTLAQLVAENQKLETALTAERVSPSNEQIWHEAHDVAAENLPRILSGICVQPGLAALLANFAIKHSSTQGASDDDQQVG